MTTWQTAVVVALMALTTLFTRALPFAVFPVGRPTPRYVVYLGRVLPFAITSMLIVFCLKNVSVLAWPHGIPELIAIVVVAALFLLFKNSLVAIAAGTILYMFLVQVVFV